MTGISFVAKSGPGGSKGTIAQHFTFDNVVCAAQSVVPYPGPQGCPARANVGLRQSLSILPLQAVK